MKELLNRLQQEYPSHIVDILIRAINSEEVFKGFIKNSFVIDEDLSSIPGIEKENNIYRYSSSYKIGKSILHEIGGIYAMDPSAIKAVELFSSTKREYILDLCAAPGGKTAQLLDAGAKVTAVDISQERLEILRENMKRLNLTDNLQIVCDDALQFSSSKKFDIILADAPCSATGTYRRHPEIIHTKTRQDVFQQAQLQKDILEHAVSLLSDDGKIVYVTCSLAKDEGEKQINTFLKQHSEFVAAPISVLGTEHMLTKEGYLRVLPQYFNIPGQPDLSGADGFFIACLQRKI